MVFIFIKVEVGSENRDVNVVGSKGFNDEVIRSKSIKDKVYEENYDPFKRVFKDNDLNKKDAYSVILNSCNVESL